MEPQRRFRPFNRPGRLAGSRGRSLVDVSKSIADRAGDSPSGFRALRASRKLLDSLERPVSVPVLVAGKPPAQSNHYQGKACHLRKLHFGDKPSMHEVSTGKDDNGGAEAFHARTLNLATRDSKAILRNAQTGDRRQQDTHDMNAMKRDRKGGR